MLKNQVILMFTGILFSLSGATGLADEFKLAKREKDRLGIAPYLSTFKTKEPKMRFMGDGDDLTDLVPFKDHNDGPQGVGLQFDINLFLRNQISKSSNEIILPRMKARKAQIQAAKKDIEDFIDSYARSGGGSKQQAMNSPDFQRFIDAKKKLETEDSKDRVQMDRINRELESPKELNKEVEKSAELFKDMLKLALSSCPNRGIHFAMVYECEGASATVLSDKLADIVERDNKLKGTYLEGLQIGRLFGENTLNSEGFGYVSGNLLLDRYGIKTFGCFKQGDGSSKPKCMVVTDRVSPNPSDEIDKVMQAKSKKQKSSVVVDRTAAKDVSVEDKEIELAKKQLEKAEEDSDGSLGKNGIEVK